MADSPTPMPSESASATPTPSITASAEATALSLTKLPALVDIAVPKILKPSIATAKQDRPTPYLDKCHTQQDLTASESDCHYGNKDSDQNIVLFGDSHALSWFPAIQKLAQAKDWSFYSLTMSSCWPANIPAWNSTTNRLMQVAMF